MCYPPPVGISAGGGCRLAPPRAPSSKSAQHTFRLVAWAILYGPTIVESARPYVRQAWFFIVPTYAFLGSMC